MVLWMALAWCLTTQSGLASVDDETAVESARGALEQWVQTRQVLSKERSDWAFGRELLEERVELVRREVESLRERVTEARENLAAAELKKEELLKEQARLQLASKELVATAGVLESRTLQLIERLPEPIEKRVEPLSQRLPDPETETTLSLSERFQNVVGILNAVNKFNRDMTLTSEVRTLADGTSAEVATLYAGLGQAWYCSGNGLAAGVGSSTAEGWVWRPATEAAAAIQRAIAILENEVVAEFVQLPVLVD
ncbi:MAG: hypothetical protein ACI9EF_001946 [Pseudohongiellaceae bacterium]|jgi:hypothetical protein